MLHSLLLVALLSAGASTPATPGSDSHAGTASASKAGCAAADGWNAGRAGRPAVCEASEYGEAHRLGRALHELRGERDEIDARVATVPTAERNALRRRQRQIDTDLEAIRGVATIRGWPLDIPPEMTP